MLQRDSSLRERNTIAMRKAYLLALLALLLASCSSVTVTLPATTPTVTGGTRNNPGPVTEPKWGTRAKTSGCTVQGPLQDLACTPGDIFPNATKADICTPGYARSVRNVSTRVKSQVYSEYGVISHSPGEYEIDHLVSLQLGGSNDISNLWPEAATPTPGFHEKDRVENYLHDEVCSGAITLKQAQIEIATNWLTVYERMPKKSQSSGSPNGAP